MNYLRPATIQDSDTLLQWRNDPQTLACFRSTTAVPREDHDLWMKFNVSHGYPEHIVMMAENPDLGSIGVVRFDAEKRDVMTYKASITIAPPYRGRGMALDILSQACGFMHEYAINAEIRQGNARSRKIFMQCGFKSVDFDADFEYYRREPLT